MPDLSLQRAVSGLFVVVTAVLASGFTLPPGFWAQWGDGKAELASYTVVRPRYGELRRGTAVVVTVTEPWLDAGDVKAERPHDAGEIVQVLKQHVVERFQTGVYDYSLATSTFTALSSSPGHSAGSVRKVVLSAQEWCGSTYREVVLSSSSSSSSRASEVVRSYFEGETAARALRGPPASEDALWLIARGLADGSPTELLRSLTTSRLLHRPAAWLTTTIAARPAEDVEVPAGRFLADVIEVTNDDGRTRLWIERGPWRRVVRMERDDGTSWQLLGAVREAYWQQHAEGDERRLAPLQLSPVSPLSPPAPTSRR